MNSFSITLAWQVLTRALLERGGGEVEDAPAALCQHYHSTLSLRFDADDAQASRPRLAGAFAQGRGELIGQAFQFKTFWQ